METHDVQKAFFDTKPVNSTDNCFVSLDDSDNDSDNKFDMNIDKSEVNLVKIKQQVKSRQQKFVKSGKKLLYRLKRKI